MKSSVQPKPVAASCQLFLRIRHPDLDPDTVTEVLGLEPEHQVRAGRSVARNGAERLHSESYWIAALTEDDFEERAESDWLLGAAKLREARALGMKFMMEATGYDFPIARWLKRLDGRREFFQRIRSEGGSVTLVIQRTDHEYPVAIRESLQRLADLGIALEVD